MDSSQNFSNLLEPGIRAAKKRLDSQRQGASPLAGEMAKKKKLRKIRQKYGGYGDPRNTPPMQYQGDPNG